MSAEHVGSSSAYGSAPQVVVQGEDIETQRESLLQQMHAVISADLQQAIALTISAMGAGDLAKVEGVTSGTRYAKP
jgi:hypothetical protein